MRQSELVRTNGSGGQAGAAVFDVVGGPLSARLVQEWDELVVRAGLMPWLGPGWLLPWWEHMGRTQPVLWTLRSETGALRSVLPLRADPRGMTSTTDWHTPEFDVAAEDDAARRQLLEHAVRRSRSRLTLEFVPEDLVAALQEVCRSQQVRFSSRVLESSPYLPLGPDWEDALGSHMVAELRRRARRLGERGEVVFEVRDGTQDLERLLDEGLRVEASGWKGRERTAILCDPATTAYYRAITRWAAERGLLRLAFLRLDGRAIAFDLGVEHAGVHYLLKNGYDESERAVAPGKQLRLAALRHFAAHGVTSYEFLGDALAWKQEWTPYRKDRFQVHAFAAGLPGAREWAVHAQLLPLARRVRDSSAAETAGRALRNGVARVRG